MPRWVRDYFLAFEIWRQKLRQVFTTSVRPQHTYFSTSLSFKNLFILKEASNKFWFTFHHEDSHPVSIIINEFYKVPRATNWRHFEWPADIWMNSVQHTLSMLWCSYLRYRRLMCFTFITSFTNCDICSVSQPQTIHHPLTGHLSNSTLVDMC